MFALFSSNLVVVLYWFPNRVRFVHLFQLEGQVIALLVQNMERLDETVKEESEGVFNTLGNVAIVL